MSDIALTTSADRAAPPKVKASTRVTPRIKRALNSMVWDCISDNEAAVQNGLTVTALRLALRHPAGRAYYREQLDVLRQRESSRNIHTLINVRDQQSNQMARVQAVKALEQLEDQQHASGSTARPAGLTIVINTNAPPAMTTIEAKPLETLQGASDE